MDAMWSQPNWLIKAIMVNNENINYTKNKAPLHNVSMSLGQSNCFEMDSILCLISTHRPFSGLAFRNALDHSRTFSGSPWSERAFLLVNFGRYLCAKWAFQVQGFLTFKQPMVGGAGW